MQMNEGKTCVIEIMCTRELGDPFRPYRSVVAWYCWRATELTGVLPA